MKELLEELLETISRALVLVKKSTEAAYAGDVENLLRVKRILEGLDPDEIDTLLEEEE